MTHSACLFFFLGLLLGGGFAQSDECSCPTPTGLPAQSCINTTAPPCMQALQAFDWTLSLYSLCGKHKSAACDPLCQAWEKANAPSPPQQDLLQLFSTQTWANYLMQTVLGMPGVQLGEVVATSNLIASQWKKRNATTSDTVFQVWYSEWAKLAQRLASEATKYEEMGPTQILSARSLYKRSALYAFVAQWPSPSIYPEGIWHSKYTFNKFAGTFKRIYQWTVPFKNLELPVIFAVPESGTGPWPLIIFTTGGDYPALDLFMQNGLDALKYGYAVLCYDGPGQGALAREYGYEDGWNYIPNWEEVGEVILQNASGLAEIDKSKVVLAGLSLGGYLNGRFCTGVSTGKIKTYGLNVTACVLDSAIYDWGLMLREHLITGIAGAAIEVAKSNPALVPASFVPFLKNGAPEIVTPMLACAKTRAILSAILGRSYSHGVMDPDAQYLVFKWTKVSRNATIMELATHFVEALVNVEPFKNPDVGSLRMPTLVLSGTEDDVAGQQATGFFNMMPKSRWNKLKIFESSTGSALHCQAGNFAEYSAVVYSWLLGVFGGAL